MLAELYIRDILVMSNTFLLDLFRNSSNMASSIFLPMHQLFLLDTCMEDHSDCKIPEVIFDKFKDK